MCGAVCVLLCASRVYGNDWYVCGQMLLSTRAQEAPKRLIHTL